MKSLIINVLIGVYITLCVPCCTRIMDWSTSQFYQGEDVSYNANNVRRYIRSIKVYDQLSTIGIFDALWLSDVVRTEYARMHARKEGRDEDRSTAFLRRQLEENRHYISFYLLVPQNLNIGSLSTDDWSVFLSIDDTIIHPVELKTVELSVEYQVFFCKRFNRFKTAYLVKFDAKGTEENPFITPETQVMSLCFRSVSKQACLTWQLEHSDLRVVTTKYQRECTDS